MRALALGALATATVAAGATMGTGAVAAVGSSAPEQVIVRGAAGCSASVVAAVSRLGGTVLRPLGILNGASAVIRADRVGALLASPCVVGVTPDGQVTLDSFGGYDPTADVGSLYNTAQEIGANTYYANGLAGGGVGVALIDSGVSPVPGLGSNQLVNGPDLSFDGQSPNLVSLDGFGHGTHMAGIIAGNDQRREALKYAGNTSQFFGIAPNAHIVNVKVADSHGASDVSQVIAGLDWVVQHAQDGAANIKVINLSFGTTSLQSYQLDPLAFAAEQAWLHGIVVVVAAGNGGIASTSLTDPAMDPYVIAVGAADTNGTVATGDDAVASFSNTGSATRSPDVVAPGVHIESLRDPGSSIDAQFGSTATVATRFFLGSGTSQAAAVVSGAMALIAQQHPAANPDQLKQILLSSATPLANDPVSRQGNGEINLTNAFYQSKQTVRQARQTFPLSTGAGTLEGARGGVDLVAGNGTILSGEQDIMGNPWSSSAMAAAEASASAWNGGTFNGSGWSGSGWSGSGWSGSGWSGSGWSGSGWSGNYWASAAWSGSGWSGSGWSGSGWSGNTWTGSGWSGSGWSGSGWSGSGWSGSGWSGSGWSGSGWSGSGWSGSGWSDGGWADAAWN